MRKLALCLVVLAAGCPPNPPPPAPTPSPTPSPVPPAPGTPGTPGGSPSPSPGRESHFKDENDAGDDPLTPGCHYRYFNVTCTGEKNFLAGDSCTGNVLHEWTDSTCHLPRDVNDHDCMKEYGGPCITVPNACGQGHASAYCKPELTEFRACPQPACAVKCSPEPKDVLCKTGGKGKAELTNYFCCCCGGGGKNTFKPAAKRSYPGETSKPTEPPPPMTH
jgi:hypothetical protein